MGETMGYDLYGTRPRSPTGEHFRRSIFGWPPLAGLCVDLAETETRPCWRWFTNDGDGLTAKQSMKLASRLEQLLAEGAVGRYLVMLRETNYEGAQSLEETDVRDLIDFLKDCGGFSIV
jgi:hypothetical protein